MTDSLRLAEHEDEFERELLAAGLSERPSPEVRAKTLARLGVSEHTAAAIAPADARHAPRWVRWLGLAAVGALALAGAVRVTRGHRGPAATASPAAQVPSPVASPPSAVNSAPSASAQALVSVPAETPSGPTPAPLAALSVKRAPPASSDDGPGLSAEIAALELARAPLQHGDATTALSALDDYRRQFPRGVMAHEATVLRIEALAKAGNMNAARALAARFLAQNPKSPHAQHIQRLLGEE